MSQSPYTADGQTLSANIDGKTINAKLFSEGADYTLYRNGKVIRLHRHMAGIDDDGQAGDGRIVAGMPGRVIDVLVNTGDEVEKDQPVLIMEAMKMEITVRADCDGVIEELPVSANDQVADGALLIAIKSEDVA